MKTGAQLINDLRVRGLSQASIAARVGTTQATISRIATGDFADTKMATWQRLSELHAQTIPATPTEQAA